MQVRRRLGQLALVLVLAGFSGLPVRLVFAWAADATPVATPTGQSAAYAWLQIGPGGTTTARAVVRGECPVLVADGRATPMGTRAAPAPPAFPVRTCEADVPDGATVVEVGGTPLRTLARTPQRIAVVGDTGCRISRWDPVQACNDPDAWPWASVAQEVADWQPDLVIHVGDYVYREDACPTGDAGCAGSPDGNTWATWEADFFAPARPLLTAAPWVFLRGNHETCDREGEGWFRLLDPRTPPAACQAFTSPYLAELDGLGLIVLDSAEAGDVRSSAQETATYRHQFTEIASLATGRPGDWLLSHKPLHAVLDLAGENREVRNESFGEAFGSGTPPEVDLVVSGHIHLSEVLLATRESGRPPQIIAGNGGTALDRPVTGDLVASELDDPALVRALVFREFGFWTIERREGAVVATGRGAKGNALVRCILVGGGENSCERQRD